MDGLGDAWVADTNKSSVLEVYVGGNTSPGFGFGGGGLTAPVALAVDGLNSVWVADKGANSVIELSNGGTVLSGLGGYTNGVLIGPRGVAIDGSGDVWVTNTGGNSVLELIGAAAPVITPIAAGLPATPTGNGSSKLGTRP
jgi:DNA-binding beta-propeller fold protein YncE